MVSIPVDDQQPGTGQPSYGRYWDQANVGGHELKVESGKILGAIVSSCLVLSLYFQQWPGTPGPW